jgi:uncharacterized protein (TIGR00297 family)
VPQVAAVSVALESLVLALVLGPLVAGLAWRARQLTGAAAVAAACLGAVSTLAGLDWVALLLAFFGTSVALGRAGRATKRARTAAVLAPEAGRTVRQVLANGGVFGAGALAAIVTVGPAGMSAEPRAVALGALAAATADTWATEIGTWIGGTPRHLLTWRPLTPGLSGGVTPAGTAATVAGALLLASIAVACGWPRPVVVAGAIGGIAGSLADSLLGATLQATRRSADGTMTERAQDVHGRATMHATGLRWIDNDAVNLACTVTGALVALAVLAARGGGSA